MISNLQRVLTDSPLLALIAVFWAGAIASLSSCTIVRIPIVLGYISGAGDSKRKSVILTILFVLGLITSYIIFGILLGLAGSLAYKFIRINKYIFWGFGVLLIIIGLFVSGLIKIKLPGSREHIQRKFHGTSYLGALFVGIVFAMIELPTCPCCGGVLLMIAGIVVAQNISFYAVLVFACFAIGQSFPILCIGLSTSLLKSGIVEHLASRAHKMEETLKLAAGNVLMALGIYFLIIA
ncbi:MAG: sulfite exporter TauE/SafE family protein [Sedimentisphaerales bacterium]|nr:sulfite exporter TauE/SafE family protein [Sedimentisphaerales bacterium]